MSSREELLRQNGSVQLEGFGMEEMMGLGIGGCEEGEGTQEKSSPRGSGYAPPTLTASKKGKSKTTTPQLLPAVALIDEDDPILPFEVEGTDDEGRDSASSLTTSRSGSNGGVQMKHRHRSAAGEDSIDLFADDSSDDDAESMVTIENDNASEFGSVAQTVVASTRPTMRRKVAVRS